MRPLLFDRVATAGSPCNWHYCPRMGKSGRGQHALASNAASHLMGRRAVEPLSRLLTINALAMLRLRILQYVESREEKRDTVAVSTDFRHFLGMSGRIPHKCRRGTG